MARLDCRIPRSIKVDQTQRHTISSFIKPHTMQHGSTISCASTPISPGSFDADKYEADLSLLVLSKRAFVRSYFPQRVSSSSIKNAETDSDASELHHAQILLNLKRKRSYLTYDDDSHHGSTSNIKPEPGSSPHLLPDSLSDLSDLTSCDETDEEPVKKEEEQKCMTCGKRKSEIVDFGHHIKCVCRSARLGMICMKIDKNGNHCRTMYAA